MAQSQSETGEPDYSQLFVYAGPEQPDPSNMTTYAHGSTELFGIPVQANIIGSSHYISAPGLNYRELTSCRPIDMVRSFAPVINHYDITRGVDDVLVRHTGTHRVEIRLSTVRMDDETALFDPSDSDVFYDFAPDGESGAPTAVSFSPTGWETWHTYPEYETALYTDTTFFEV